MFKFSNYAILLPSEVQFLFEEYFDKFCSKLLGKECRTDESKSQWLHEFTTDSPISNSYLEYGCVGGVPFQFQQVSKDFEILARDLGDIRHRYAREKSDTNSQASQLTSMINGKRNTVLKTLKSTRDAAVAPAQNKRDEAFKKLPPNDVAGNKKIREEYKSSTLTYKVLYKAAQAATNVFFDGKVAEVETQRRQAIATIEKNENGALADYYNYARSMLSYAQQLKAGTQNSIVPPPQPVFAPAPTLKIEVNFNYQNLPKPEGVNDSMYHDYLSLLSAPSAPPED